MSDSHYEGWEARYAVYCKARWWAPWRPYWKSSTRVIIENFLQRNGIMRRESKGLVFNNFLRPQ